MIPEHLFFSNFGMARVASQIFFFITIDTVDVVFKKQSQCRMPPQKARPPQAAAPFRIHCIGMLRLGFSEAAKPQEKLLIKTIEIY